MSPAEVATAVRLRLVAEIVDDLKALEQLGRAISQLLVPASDARGEWMRALALAFEIERYYTAIESLLTRILRTVDGDVPSGTGWHQELLRAAVVAIDNSRPCLLSRESMEELRELLKFRHLARHGYEGEPELGRMVEHAKRVERIQVGIKQSLDIFCAWLRDV